MNFLSKLFGRKEKPKQKKLSKKSKPKKPTKKEYIKWNWSKPKRRLVKTMHDKGIEILISQDPSNMNYLTGYDAWSFYYAQCAIVHVNADEPLCFVRAQDAGGAYITTYLKNESVIVYDENYIHKWPKHP